MSSWYPDQFSILQLHLYVCLSNTLMLSLLLSHIHVEPKASAINLNIWRNITVITFLGKFKKSRE
jgi:hypothetical protein